MAVNLSVNLTGKNENIAQFRANIASVSLNIQLA